MRTCVHRSWPAFLFVLALFLPGPHASLAWASQEGPLRVVPEVGAGEGDPFAERLEAVRERIGQRLGDPGVAADLYELRDLLDEGGSLERASVLLGQVIRSGRVYPDVRALARRLLADVERMRGRLPRAEQQLAELGMIRELTVIGPFDNENQSGYDTAYGPEQELDLDKEVPGLRARVGWRRVRDLGRTGTIALGEAMRPAQDVVVYALVVATVPRDQEAVLYLGTPGPTKLWHLGRPVLASQEQHPARFDQRSVRLRLRRGDNPLLLKVAVGDERLDLHLRLVGTDGRPLRGLRLSAPTSGTFPTPEAIPPGRRIAGRRPLVDELERASAARSSARAIEDYARVLAARHPFDRSERRHRDAAVRAARAAPWRVEAQLLAAQSSDDHNEEREWLERAVAVERPGHARAHAKLASHWLDHGHPHRALEVLTPALSQAPDDWPARIVWMRALGDLGEGVRAYRESLSLLERFRDEPAVYKVAARYAGRVGRVDEAIQRLRVALALRPADEEASASLVWRLADRGDVQGAIQALAASDRLLPTSVSRMAQRADLLAANGDAEEALALYAEALEISPRDAELWRRRAEVEMRAGRSDEAIASLERASELRPQSAELREQLRLLRDEETWSARAYLRDLEEVVRTQPAEDEEDAVQLVRLQAVRVLPSGQASRTVQQIVKVQSPRGVDRFRTFRIRYTPGRDEVRVVRARIRKPDGSYLTSYTEYERSLNDAWSGLYYDARMKQVSFPALAPGDVVELVYRLDDVARDNLLSDYFGDIAFIEDTQPIAHWEYVLEMPEGRPIFFNEPEGATYERKEAEGGGTIHRWVARDVAKVVPEPRMPGWTEVAAHLHVSTYEDWDDVARFWWGLVREQVKVTPEIERIAREIVADISPLAIEERVKAIHAYVLERTRYVGLEFGIHSFKPYPVEQVLRRGFGDCKDKASLTYALLRAVGIDSRLVLLRMRNLGRIADKPASLAVFNHAVLYVPALDLFLDGTAEWSGSKELPEVDRGADILVVEPEGRSTLARTEEASAELSYTLLEEVVELRVDGSALVTGRRVVEGLHAPSYRRSYASPNGRIATFERSLSRTYPGAKVLDFEIGEPRQIEEPVRLRYEAEVATFATPDPDGRTRWTPGGQSRSLVRRYAALSSRSFDLVLRYPWSETVRFELELPAGLVVESLPEDASLEGPFGSMHASYRHEEGRLLVEMRFTVSKARIAPEDYPAFRSFLREVDRAMGRRVVLAPQVVASP